MLPCRINPNGICHLEYLREHDYTAKLIFTEKCKKSGEKPIDPSQN